MTLIDTPLDARPQRPAHRPDVVRASTWCGIAFAACQLAVMVAMAVFVLPNGGSPGDPPLLRGARVLDAADAYRWGNYAFMVAGSLLLGFVGAVGLRLRRADGTGVLATVAVAAGTLLAVVWPLAGVLHDTAIEAAASGGDVRILAGWDSVAPFALAFSAFPRIFLLVAVVLALRLTGEATWLRRSGAVIAGLSAVGSATLVVDAMFPLLALSTLAYELWIAALAWHWLRSPLPRT